MKNRNARVGLILFVVYLVLYGGFVFTNAFAPELMERTPFAGVNLAILCGFGLIGAALVIALVYGVICRGSPPGCLPDDETGIAQRPRANPSDRKEPGR